MFLYIHIYFKYINFQILYLKTQNDFLLLCNCVECIVKFLSASFQKYTIHLIYSNTDVFP